MTTARWFGKRSARRVRRGGVYPSSTTKRARKVLGLSAIGGPGVILRYTRHMALERELFGVSAA